MFVRGGPRDQVEIFVVELGQPDRLLPVAISLVSGIDLLGVAFQRHHPRGGRFLRQLNGTPTA